MSPLRIIHKSLVIAFSAVLWLSGFLLAADDPFAAGVRTTPWLKPEDEQKLFKLPDGFEINLVAAEPDIQKPLNMAFDEKGRIWLTCTVEYPYAAPPDRPGKDSIRILEDADGDGRYEKVSIFADGLNIPMGIYPWKGGCIAFSIPNIWHLEDTDGDGKCDKRTVLYGPFDTSRDTHGMCNAFRRGFDGWLYACHGFNNDSHVKGADGNEVHLNSGNTFRFKLDGSRIEHYTHGQVNPFGMCFDELFNIFTADCHSKPIYQLLQGGYYPSFGKPDGGLGFIPPMMEHLHGSTAICGLVCYSGDNFPQPYRGNFFSGNVMTSRINRNSPIFHGSTLQAKEEADFLSAGDPWFRPVDIQIGPDNALYILDFYNRIIGHYEVPLPHPGRDRTSGRIWRIAYKGPDPECKPARPAADLTKLDPRQWVAALDHPNLEQRLRALNFLVDGPRLKAKEPLDQQELEALRRAAFASQQIRQKTAAIWALGRLMENATGAEGGWAGQLLDDQNRDVRFHAIKATGERSKLDSAALEATLKLVGDPDPFVARAATEVLSRHPTGAGGLQTILNESAKTPVQDALLLHARKLALRENLLAIGDLAKVADLQLSAEALRQLMPIALAVPSPGAAALIIRYLEKHDEPKESLLAYLEHAARYAPPEGVEALVKLTRAKFASDLDLQTSILQSLHAGLSQRGRNADQQLAAWGEELARALLALDPAQAIGWKNTPAEGAAPSENPWVFQIRVSQDGDKNSTFYCSLPRGETLTGVYRSGSFPLPPKLSFWCAGHSGIAGEPINDKNHVRLRAAPTGELLADARPPRNDTAQRIEWDLATHAGKQGYVEIVDADTAVGYAWLAVGRFSLPELNPSRQSQHQAAAAEIAAKLKLASLRPDLVKLLTASATDGAVRGAIGKALVTLSPDSRAAALATVIGEPAMSETLRTKLGEAIIGREPAKLQEALREAVKLLPQRLQTLLAETLAGDAEGAESLLLLAKEGQISARLLAAASVAAKLQSSAGDDLKKRISELTASLPGLNEELEKLIAQRRAAYALAKPSRENGDKLFKKNCAACHQLEGQGAVIGPQLDGIGNRGLERLLEDILDPNRNVDVAFRTTTIQTTGGQVIAGLFRREEGALLVLADNKGKEFTVRKDEIEQQAKTPLSLMPGNVQEILSPAELNDLLVYLLSKRGAPPNSELPASRIPRPRPKPVDTTAALVAAVRDGAAGAMIEIAAGTYDLESPLELKAQMTLKGAGMAKTIITNASRWKPSTKTLPDPEMTTKGMDTNAYLIRLQDNAAGITISDLTLHGPQVHGAIYGWEPQDLTLHHVQIKETLSSGLRTFGMKKAKIHDCEFIDAGGRWEKGEPGIKGGLTGGGVFAVWMAECEIFDNRFVRTKKGPAEEFYGIKVRQGIRCHIHHNTIEANFSMEFPFENDEDNEIDHNVCHGTISIPKYAGGVTPKSGRTFHIHHNWMKDSYAVEFVRNGVEIDHNFFDFDPKQDHGNLISAFGDAAAKGPASFHNNLVSNPGRGVIWINEVFNHLEIRNNHIIARTTATPRTEGLFGFNGGCDFKTISMKDNLIECQGQARPLLRAKESYAATVENNTLTNVSDAEKLTNAKADRPVGLEKPLKFECGVRGEFTVDGWQVRPTRK